MEFDNENSRCVSAGPEPDARVCVTLRGEEVEIELKGRSMHSMYTDWRRSRNNLFKPCNRHNYTERHRKGQVLLLYSRKTGIFKYNIYDRI